jgi:hypothetical protein
VCDDIRQEVGNKLTLVGVYNDKIVFRSSPGTKEFLWPASLKLGFFVKLSVDKEDIDRGIDSFELEVLLDDEKVLQKVRGNIELKAGNKLLQLIAVNPLLAIPSVGEMSLKITFMKSDKKILEVSSEIPFNITVEPNKQVH